MTEAERVAIWKKKNPEKYKAQKRRYYEKHKDEEEYREKNRERNRRYYERHRKKA